MATPHERPEGDPTSNSTLHESLLIVDDRLDVLHALERFMSMYFRQVLIAATPSEAEALLARYHPEHLLCDYRLGQEDSLATSLIPRWREAHPSLRRVALMTGSGGAQIKPCAAVDEVFHKPLDVTRVIEFFAAAQAAV